ncbi:MAG: GNAT family N-acetyltransferase [Nitrosomonas sp.]|nr:MAG: GNAT family N-acetyltransferase [Nitrosomonas sp.]
MKCSYRLRIVKWKDEEAALRSIRTAVFIHEQHVPVHLEWDEFDAISMHILAQDFDEQSIGTVRLLPNGYVSRMAVLKEWRRKGIGTAMMQKLLQQAENLGVQQIKLNAQVSAIQFYERFGFQVFGKEFMDAGILHIKMELRLNVKL